MTAYFNICSGNKQTVLTCGVECCRCPVQGTFVNKGGCGGGGWGRENLKYFSNFNLSYVTIIIIKIL